MKLLGEMVDVGHQHSRSLLAPCLALPSSTTDTLDSPVPSRLIHQDNIGLNINLGLGALNTRVLASTQVSTSNYIYCILFLMEDTALTSKKIHSKAFSNTKVGTVEHLSLN